MEDDERLDFAEGYMAGWNAAKADSKHETLADAIYDINPTETPFLMTMGGKKKRKLSAAHKAAISRAAKKRARAKAAAKR